MKNIQALNHLSYQEVLLILFPKHVANPPYSYEIHSIYVNLTATTANHTCLYTNP